MSSSEDAMSDASARDVASAGRSAAKRCRVSGECLFNFLCLPFVVVCTFIVGVVVFSTAGNYSVLTSLYVITQVFTTIGYGDVTPESDNMRLFMTFYVLWLLVIVAYISNRAVQKLIERNNKRVKAKLLEVEQHGLDDEESPPKKKRNTTLMALAKLIVPFGLFVLFLLFGMLFYWLYEDCHCSYGVTHVEGCDDTNKCTVGKTKNPAEAFYMSVITLTTVGFGDYTPESRVGRWIFLVWGPVGIIVTAYFISALQTFFFEVQPEDEPLNIDEASNIDEELFKSMDVDGNGYLSRLEFITYVLVKHRLCDEKTIAAITEGYSQLDPDGTNDVTYEQVVSRRKDVAAAAKRQSIVW